MSHILGPGVRPELSNHCFYLLLPIPHAKGVTPMGGLLSLSPDTLGQAGDAEAQGCQSLGQDLTSGPSGLC